MDDPFLTIDPGRSLLASSTGGSPFTFEDTLFLCATLWVIWLLGKAVGLAGLPELIGQILAGILMGPHGVDLAPKHDALMLIGEVGLLLMVLEAGLEVDLGMLRVVGTRGVIVAFMGSLLPLALGFGIATAVFGLEAKQGLAVGASLAPTSMGISLKVLEEGKVLNTPIGQLIIAAAVIDDVIALVLLSELEALQDPSAINFIIPIVASLGFILGIGLFAILVVPKLLERGVLPFVPQEMQENTLLCLALMTGYCLMAACHYGRSSHLLGAFLGGLCFCTMHQTHKAWRRDVLQVLSWLIRVFFACTIGFEVPIRDLWTKEIISRAALLLLAGIGKLATGVMAMPLSCRNFSMVGWAMAAWGEFAFIVATASREMGTMDEETYGAVILAVLMSAFYAPIGVTMSLGKRNGVRSLGSWKDVFKSFFEGSNSTGGRVLHSVYYRTSLVAKSRWGLMDKLTRSLNTTLDVEILDFWVSIEGHFSHFQFYLKDHKLKSPGIEHKCAENDAAEKRCEELRSSLANVLNIPLSCGEEDDGTPEVAIMDGELQCHVMEYVILERWEPSELDTCAPDDDDEHAFQEAHRGLVRHASQNNSVAKAAPVSAWEEDEQNKRVPVRIIRSGGSRTGSFSRYGGGYGGQGPLFRDQNMHAPFVPSDNGACRQWSFSGRTPQNRRSVEINGSRNALTNIPSARVVPYEGSIP